LAAALAARVGCSEDISESPVGAKKNWRGRQICRPRPILMAAALLGLKFGLLLDPSGAQTTWRTDLVASRHRDRVLAYGLHFAQQFLAVGEPATALEILDAYASARREAGSMGADRRLVALRPQVLAARVESLQRESTALDRIARSAAAAGSSSPRAEANEAATAASTKRAELKAAEAALDDARREQRRLEATAGGDARRASLGATSPSAVADYMGRMSLGGGDPLTTGFTPGRTPGSAAGAPRPGAPPLVSAIGAPPLVSAIGGHGADYLRRDLFRAEPQLATPSRTPLRPRTAPSPAATPVATAQPSDSAPAVVGLGGGFGGGFGAELGARGSGFVTGSRGTDGASSVRSSFGGFGGFGAAPSPLGGSGRPSLGYSGRPSLGSSAAPPSASRQRYNLSTPSGLPTPPTVRSAAAARAASTPPKPAASPGAGATWLGGAEPTPGARGCPATPCSGAASTPARSERAASATPFSTGGATPRRSSVGDIATQASEWKRQATQLRTQTALLLGSLPGRLRAPREPGAPSAAERLRAAGGGSGAAAGATAAGDGAPPLPSLEPWIFAYLLADPTPPMERPILVSASDNNGGGVGTADETGLWELTLQPASGTAFTLTLRLFAEAAPATLALLDASLASKTERSRVRGEAGSSPRASLSFSFGDASAAAAAALPQVLATERSRLKHCVPELVSVALATTGGGAAVTVTKLAIALDRGAPLGADTTVVGRAVGGLGELADWCGAGGEGGVQIVGWTKRTRP